MYYSNSLELNISKYTYHNYIYKILFFHNISIIIKWEEIAPWKDSLNQLNCSGWLRFSYTDARRLASKLAYVSTYRWRLFFHSPNANPNALSLALLKGLFYLKYIEKQKYNVDVTLGPP